MHLYVFLKAKAALSFGLKAGVPLVIFMILMILAPILVRMFEKAGQVFLAQIMSYAGYVWLGLLFLFISFALSVDFYRLCMFAVKYILKKESGFMSITPQISFFLPLVLSLIISFYGYFEAQNIRTERFIIKTPGLPKETIRLKIVQISDVHLGLIVRQNQLNRILNIVRKENPDILVSTGDLVDGQIDNLSGLSEMLSEIKPRYGKFAITGNHEYYAGLKQALSFIEKSGFTILRNQGVTIEGLINIAGVDDPINSYSEGNTSISEKEMLSKLPRDKFTLLLKHRPIIDKNAHGYFDLQISGHTHKGQIFPFTIVTWLYYPKHAGCLNPVDNCYLYVSRGSGTWGPPIRFLSPPEVTVFELVHDGGGQNTIEKSR